MKLQSADATLKPMLNSEKNTKLLATGTAASALGVLIGHPLDTVKAHAQTKNLGFIPAGKEVFGRAGLLQGTKNLYGGITPNLSKKMINNTWRVPLTTQSPKVFANTTGLNDEKGKPTFRQFLRYLFYVQGQLMPLFQASLKDLKSTNKRAAHTTLNSKNLWIKGLV